MTLAEQKFLDCCLKYDRDTFPTAEFHDLRTQVGKERLGAAANELAAEVTEIARRRVRDDARLHEIYMQLEPAGIRVYGELGILSLAYAELAEERKAK